MTITPKWCPAHLDNSRFGICILWWAQHGPGLGIDDPRHALVLDAVCLMLSCSLANVGGQSISILPRTLGCSRLDLLRSMQAIIVAFAISLHYNGLDHLISMCQQLIKSPSGRSINISRERFCTRERMPVDHLRFRVKVSVPKSCYKQ